MQYAEFLDQAQDGDILLFNGSPLYSRVIQRWTKSSYSHVGMVGRMRAAGHEWVDCLESMEGFGIRNFPLEEYLRQGVRIDFWRLTDPMIDRSKAVRWFMDRRGKRYSSLHQLWRSFITVPLLESLGIPTKIDNDRFFCSYAVAESLLHAGLILPPDDSVRPELASPGAISLLPCVKRVGPITL